MAIAYVDALGPVLDTGSNSLPTARANVEVEQHTSLEVDTGSKTLPVNESAQHIPHRAIASPR